jgi:outer membrane lipoprotein-sorting protein
MRRNLSPIILAALLFAGGIGIADPAGGYLEGEAATRALEAIRAKSRGASSVRASFRQVVTTPGLRDPAVSMGELLVVPPDRVRIDFSEPAGEFVLLFDGRVWVARRGRPVEERPSGDRLARPLASLGAVLGGREPADADEWEKRVRIDSGAVTVELTPRAESRDRPRRIESVFDSATGELMRMRVSLPRGAAVEYRLERVERDAGVTVRELLDRIPGAVIP